MDEEPEQIVEVLLGSAAGAQAHLAESATGVRGAAPVHFTPAPKVGPSGGSGASDAAEAPPTE